MQITVKLYGTLRRRRPSTANGAPHHPFMVEMPAGCSIRDLEKQLGIQEGSVNAVAVNGEATVEDVILQDGDMVRFFPPSAGG